MVSAGNVKKNKKGGINYGTECKSVCRVCIKEHTFYLNNQFIIRFCCYHNGRGKSEGSKISVSGRANQTCPKCSSTPYLKGRNNYGNGSRRKNDRGKEGHKWFHLYPGYGGPGRAGPDLP